MTATSIGTGADCGCCTDEAECGDICDDCFPFYTVEFSSIGNGTCDECDVINKVWCIQWPAPGCYWSSVFTGDTEWFCGNYCDIYFIGPSIPQPWWWLFMTGSQVGGCDYFGNAIVEYKSPESVFCCVGSCILEYHCDDGACTGWPATITLVPVVGCP